MDAFLTQPLERQRFVFEEAGRRLGLSAGSVEKDLWVCWTLREGSAAPKARLARHYYDLWCLITRGTAERAVRDSGLFDRVAAHRAVFFRRSRDAQASFAPGSLRIVPAADRLAQWRRDYDAMRESMFFGEVPDFAEIVDVVGRFQEAFNVTRKKPT